MKSIASIAWKRFNIIGSIVGHVQGRIFVTALYFTLVVPFAGLARLITGPLTSKADVPAWLPREPLPTDLDSARDQS